MTANVDQSVDAKVGTNGFLSTSAPPRSGRRACSALAKAENIDVGFLVTVTVLNLNAGTAGSVRASIGDGAR